MYNKLLTGLLILLACSLFIVLVSNIVIARPYKIYLTPTPNKGAMVDNDYADRVIASIMKQADKIKLIEIDSPGGSVAELEKILKHMNYERHYLGTKFSCYVSGEAYSAAMILFSQCEYRFMHYKASIMWHPARVGLMGYLTTEDAVRLAQYLVKLQTQLNHVVASAMKIEWSVLYPLYIKEQIMPTPFVVKLAPEFTSVVNSKEEWINATEMGWLFKLKTKNHNVQ